MKADKPGKVTPVTRRRFLTTAAAGGSLSLVGGGNTLWAADGPAMSAGEALASAESRRDELVDLLSQMIRVRSQTGETAEAAQQVVAGYLSGLPYQVEQTADRPSAFEAHSEYTPPSPPGDGPFVNVVGRPNSGNGKRIALFAHIDSHIVEDGWSTEPYQPVIKDGRLYGLGSADDKGGVAAMLVAASILAKQEGPAPIVISHHGKGGGSRGSLPIFERFRASKEPIDAVLYAHPAETGKGLADIKHVVRGVLDLQLSVTGWRGAPLEIGLPDSALWSESGDALTACWSAIESLKADVLSDVNVNVGVLDAGDRQGSVPDSAVASIRIIFSEQHNWEDLLAATRSSLEEFFAGSDSDSQRFQMALEVGQRTNAGAVPWDAETSIVLRGAIESVTGDAPKSYPNHFAGDIRFPLRLLDAPAFGIGSLAGNFYGPDEWVDIDDLVRLVAVLVTAVAGWANLSDG